MLVTTAKAPVKSARTNRSPRNSTTRRVQPTDGDVSRRQREQRAKVTQRPGQLAPVELELSNAHLWPSQEKADLQARSGRHRLPVNCSLLQRKVGIW
jgi:hypothetical protein